MKTDLVQDAVMRNLQTLSESTTRLTQELRETESTIDWDEIRSFRNVVTHGYLEIDRDLVWRAVERLPELLEAVERMKTFGSHDIE